MVSFKVKLLRRAALSPASPALVQMVGGTPHRVAAIQQHRRAAAVFHPLDIQDAIYTTVHQSARRCQIVEMMDPLAGAQLHPACAADVECANAGKERIESEWSKRAWGEGAGEAYRFNVTEQ